MKIGKRGARYYEKDDVVYVLRRLEEPFGETHCFALTKEIVERMSYSKYKVFRTVVLKNKQNIPIMCVFPEWELNTIKMCLEQQCDFIHRFISADNSHSPETWGKLVYLVSRLNKKYLNDHTDYIGNLNFIPSK